MENNARQTWAVSGSSSRSAKAAWRPPSKAYQPGLDRNVAVKSCLPTTLTKKASPNGSARGQGHRPPGSSAHPASVRLWPGGQPVVHRDEIPWQGGHAQRPAGQPLSPRRARPAQQIGAALDHAHDMGILHRT